MSMTPVPGRSTVAITSPSPWNASSRARPMPPAAPVMTTTRLGFSIGISLAATAYVLCAARLGQNFMDGIVGVRRANRQAGTKTHLLALGRHPLLLHPVERHDAPRDAPFIATLLEDIAIAPGHEKLPGDAVFSRTTLQGEKVGLDGGPRRSGEFDQDVADLMNVARAALEHLACPQEEPLHRPGIDAVPIGCVGPIGAAQRGFVGSIDAPAIPVDAIADRLAIQKPGQFCFVDHDISPSQQPVVTRERLRCVEPARRRAARCPRRAASP